MNRCEQNMKEIGSCFGRQPAFAKIQTEFSVLLLHNFAPMRSYYLLQSLFSAPVKATSSSARAGHFRQDSVNTIGALTIDVGSSYTDLVDSSSD